MKTQQGRRCDDYVERSLQVLFIDDADTKEEMGEKCEACVDTISLETSISREDYLRYKRFLTETSGKLFS